MSYNEGEKRLEWLDALRGWAILGVVLVHTGQSINWSSNDLGKLTSWGRYGVQLFFMVSAITISMTYNSYLRKYGAGLRTSFAWLIKRFFRIAPLYYFAIIVYEVEQYAIFIASHQKNGHPLNAIKDIISNVLFVHTWIPSANNSVVPGGWSIGVEAFFYLLVPMIWAISGKQLRSLVLVLSIIPALTLSLFLSKVTTGTDIVDGFFINWFPTQFPVLAIGLIFYLVAMGSTNEVRSKWLDWLFILFFIVFMFLALICGTWMGLAPVLSPTLVAIAFANLIAALQNPTIEKLFVNGLLSYLGQLS